MPVDEPKPQHLGVELEIDSLAVGGRGVGRHDGLVWLVEGALPGDRVAAEALQAHPRWVEARAVRILRTSPARREAVCPVQAECGGCSWMILDDEEQRTWKRTLLVDALARIGGISGPRVDPTIAAPDSLGYRNKIELTFGTDVRGQPTLGYHRGGADRVIVDVERCAVADPIQHNVVTHARGFFLHGPGAASPAFRLVVRSSRSTGQCLVGLVGRPGPFPQLAQFAALLRGAVPEVASVVRIEPTGERRGGARTVAVSGPPWIEETLAGISFRLPAATFFQVNPSAAERLVEVVEDLARVQEGERLLELYGGVGAFSLALSRRGATAVVCEADLDAVACGRQAARDAGNLPVRFERGDVGRFLAGLAVPGAPRPDVVLADPPRAGLGRRVASAIATLGASRIVLVSCDPATLARDVKELVGSGYRLARAVPVDMFPQTPHVEAVALLVRGA